MKLSNFFRKTKKILIVEDDVTLRTSLRERFAAEGHVVFEAGDAGEVLSTIGRKEPDVLVLDLILPLKDGISLLEELRTAGHHMPVVILSNLLGSEDLRADAERLHAAFYNKSSTSLEDIVEAVVSRL
jgi:two-component system response regulator MprA